MNHLINFAKEFGYTPDEVRSKWCFSSTWSKINPTLEQYYPMIYIGDMACDKLHISRDNLEIWLCQKIDAIFGALILKSNIIMTKEHISFDNEQQFNDWIISNIDTIEQKIKMIGHCKLKV